ncbi:MAG: hypothetical protein F6K50_02810 [Moorea sp. SIO3I7]|uniref:hypothetical protein n=1 Tax=Moorena sp. SIO3I8 TaxID=2607833 RepID=UPI0013BF7589|nr:hypothetical protein [Moorena sp. SIO3I8]NEN94493.1 hypothetical protein [Moorena sp. SIO3I7]NEO07403.1 hypothetical protein [Moorena sp. SIO3I8]NEP52930.1 hypothetical protein [Moorena sp. SIO3C2]
MVWVNYIIKDADADMANQGYINESGSTSFRKSSGTGTDQDPFIPEFHEPSIGELGDSEATSDTGAFSLIALTKRGLTKWATLFSALGAATARVATSDTGSFTLIALFKRSLERWTTLLGVMGAAGNTPATNDTGTFSLISLFKRSLQRWTTFINTVGTIGQASSKTGSLMARLAYIADNLPTSGGGGGANPYSLEFPTMLVDVGSDFTSALNLEVSNWHCLSVFFRNKGNRTTSGVRVWGCYSSKDPASCHKILEEGEEFYKKVNSTSNQLIVADMTTNNRLRFITYYSNNIRSIPPNGTGQIHVECKPFQKILITVRGSTRIELNGLLTR